MSLAADIEVSGPELVLGPTIRAIEQGTLRAQYQATAEAYTFVATDVDTSALEAALSDDGTVTNWRCIESNDQSRTYRADVAVDRPLVSGFAGDLDVQILAAESGTEGWVFDVRLPDRERLVAFKDTCEAHGLSVRLRSLYTQVPRTDGYGDIDVDLTPGQREALRTAYRAGYFEVPREAALEEVAASLGVSSTAVSGRLRRATKRLVEHHGFGDR